MEIKKYKVTDKGMKFASICDDIAEYISIMPKEESLVK
jgi:hypothetical protein